MSSAGELIEDITNQPLPHDVPRPRRVAITGPPSGFSLDQDSPPPPPASPPLPTRSPLRPLSRSISASSTMSVSTTTTKQQRFRRPATPPPLEIEDFASIAEEPIPLTFQIRHRSFPTIDDESHTGGQPISKGLPPRPDSPVCLSIEDEADSSSSSSSAPQEQAPMTKRQHALHELLSSERAYASDLALIREVHIPLALGQQVPLAYTSPTTPPPLSSSSSSSRTVSVSSDSSSGSLGPPMTPEDTRIIFSNIAELAMFADQLSDGLEEALGSTLEGGQGEDHVGALFLEIIPELEKPYKYYINRHPAALAHLAALPQTPALAAYMQHTQSVASNLSHAWDLASLLIKPIQRLLKYSLLLAAIIDETPDTHGDKETLKLARVKMEEVARNVNEGRRRAEVVREVLTAKRSTKPGVNVSVAASVNLTKMKSLTGRHGGSGGGGGKNAQLATAGGADANGETARVERMQGDLKRVDVFAQQFAKNVVDWARMMNNLVLALRAWAINFGKVIGLSSEQGSEAFDAFLAVVEEQLVPLCHQLEADVNERLLKEIAHLLTTMNQPLKLLASMNEQEPFHYHLMTMNVSAKNRPPASLLAASTNYLALRGQLAAELPTYLVLLHRGLSVCVRRLSEIQTAFWGAVRDRWAELWEMLRVEGEMNAGHMETIAVWHTRWADVDEIVAGLNVTQAKKLYQEPSPSRYAAAAAVMSLASLDPQVKAYAPSVMGVLAALEPTHVAPHMQYVVSSPQPLQRGRPRGQSDASSGTGAGLTKRGSVTKQTSNDSFPSMTATLRPQRKKSDGFMDFVAGLPTQGPRHKSPRREQEQQRQEHPPIPQMTSMPHSPSERTVSPRNSSSSKTAVEGDTTRLSQEIPDDDRGRTGRKPSLRRKLTDSIRPSSSSGRQRSSSKSNQASFFEDYDAPASPPPPQLHQPPQQRNHTSTNRDSWVARRAKYVCQVVHPCKPPAAVSYFSFPFFTLVESELFEVLHEAGHPSMHPKLPLYVDDGEDCLLLCRDGAGNVGWALASFLAPVEGLVLSG